MDTMNITDRLYTHLEQSTANNYHAEQHRQLLNRILFDGDIVDEVTYQHAQMVYNVAKSRNAIGDADNAKLFLYYTARCMGLVE